MRPRLTAIMHAAGELFFKKAATEGLGYFQP